MKSIAIFCGSSTGADPIFAEAARAMGRAIAERELRLVYGAGSVGLMGIVANEVLAHGGKVLGVIPQFLVDLEVGHTGLTELIVTETMHERKLAMAEAADGFIAMPGGIGTLEELIEVLTWTQLGVHQKQCGLFNVGGYWDHLIRMIDHMVDQRFLKSSQAKLLHTGTFDKLSGAADAGALLGTVLAEGPAWEGKWLG